MPINVICTNCSTTLRAPDTSAGKKVKCPKCAAILTVPSADEVLEEVPLRVQVPPPPLPGKSREDEEEPRHRSRRDDEEESYDDDQPRRRSRRQPAEASDSNNSAQFGLGIASLSVGLVGLIMSFIPCLNACVAPPFVIIGFLLGMVGLIIALTQKNRGIAFPAAGTAVSLAAGVVLTIWLAWVGAALNQSAQQFNQGVQHLQEQNRRNKEANQKKEDDERQKSQNNLKQLYIAMLNHAGTYGTKLPKAINTNLSWRVALLPFLEQIDLYQKFRQDEPWNSPHNRKLANLMPDIYKPVRGNPGGNRTYYQVVTGNLGLFGIQPQPRLPASFIRGTANTILIVESGNAVEWTKPQDIVYNGQPKYVPGQQVPRLGGVYNNGFYAVMGDASVYFFEQARYNDSKIHTLITPNDLEPVELPQP